MEAVPYHQPAACEPGRAGGLIAESKLQRPVTAPWVRVKANDLTAIGNAS